MAPATPPMAPAGSRANSRRRCPIRSSDCANVAPRYPGQSATVLVTLAATAGTPTAMSIGKVMSVPPPARAFTAPATTAARKTSANSGPVTTSVTQRHPAETGFDGLVLVTGGRDVEGGHDSSIRAGPVPRSCAIPRPVPRPGHHTTRGPKSRPDTRCREETIMLVDMWKLSDHAASKRPVRVLNTNIATPLKACRSATCRTGSARLVSPAGHARSPESATRPPGRRVRTRCGWCRAIRLRGRATVSQPPSCPWGLRRSGYRTTGHLPGSGGVAQGR